MSPEQVLGHLAYKIANATINPFPFPHFFIRDVFPDEFYDTLTQFLPNEIEYEGVEGKYKGRKFNDTTELAMLEPLRGKDFTNIAAHPFRTHIAKRFGGQMKGSTDLRLVLDGEGYSIGPHTDTPAKVLSFLFYLPNPESSLHLYDHGTSIYLPIDQTFRCEGGPHYAYENFVKIATMPFIPNSLFGFFKTNFSFHGVEPITIPVRRDVLLWNLYGSA